VAEEEGKVDLRCCGRSRFRTWLIVYRDRRWLGGGGDTDEEWPCSDVGHWVNTSALWREELKTCGVIGGRAPPPPRHFCGSPNPNTSCRLPCSSYPFLSIIYPLARMSFFFMKSFPPALSRDRVLTTVTRAWKIPASNPSRNKKLFSSRLTGHFHLLPKLRISGVVPLLSHLPSRCLQGQLYFITRCDKFLFILLNSIFALSSIFWARLSLTRFFWISLFSCFHGITGVFLSFWSMLQMFFCLFV